MFTSKSFIAAVTTRNCFKRLVNRAKGTRQYCEDAEETYVSSTTRCEMQIDPEIDKQLLGGAKPRKHTGKRSVSPIKVPERFTKALYAFIQNSDLNTKDMETKGTRFRNQTISRMPPATRDEVLDAARTIVEDIMEKDDVNVEELDQEAKESWEETNKNKMMSKLKARVYNWKPIEYDEQDSRLYLYGLFAPNYATMFRIFSEIKAMVPNFMPKTLLDFGCGIGSVIWAANDCFDKNVSEVLCVDASSEMSNLAQVLLQDGDPKGEIWVKHISFKKYLPPSNLLKYDLVVCAHTLLDMPTSRERIQVINNLWNKTTGMLVIVEHGSYAGFSLIAEARDYILSKFNEDPEKQNAHVVAPCPHNLPCPRVLTTAKRPCSLPVKFHPLSLEKERKPQMEKYSYVVLSKRKQTESTTWPRLVSPVLKRPRHVVCRFCNVDGQLYESVITKKKNGKHMYRLAKCSKWGDLLPGCVGENKVTPDTDVQDSDDSSSDSESDSEEQATKER